MPQGVDPTMRVLHACQTRDFRLGMGNDIAHLSVRPDVVLLGRDIQIAKQDTRFFFGLSSPPGGLFINKAQFMGEFWVGLGIGNITSGWDIDIMDFPTVRQTGMDVAALRAAAS